MYENLNIHDYIKRMQERDERRTSQVIDWVEENWTPGETFTLKSGGIIQYKDFRGDLDGISKN